MVSFSKSLKVILCVVCIFSLATGGNKQKDIEKILTLTGSAQMAVQVIEQMVGAFKQTMPNAPAKFWDDFMKEVDPNDLVKLMVPVYDKHFTHDDIKQLIKFYESPIGKKFLEKTPMITQESMTAGQQWGQQLAARVPEKLQAEGHK